MASQTKPFFSTNLIMVSSSLYAFVLYYFKFYHREARKAIIRELQILKLCFVVRHSPNVKQKAIMLVNVLIMTAFHLGVSATRHMCVNIGPTCFSGNFIRFYRKNRLYKSFLRHTNLFQLQNQKIY